MPSPPPLQRVLHQKLAKAAQVVQNSPRLLRRRTTLRLLGNRRNCRRALALIGPLAAAILRRVARHPPLVLHQTDAAGAEPGEERALIAEGFALLVSGARNRHRGGRPKVIDAEMKVRIATLMGTGLSLRQAAACLGIAHTTIARAVDDDPEFKHDVDLARTRATLHPLACILRESGKNWKAAVWLLEHLSKVAYQEKTPLEKAEANVRSTMASQFEKELTPRLLAEARAASGIAPTSRPGRNR